MVEPEKFQHYEVQRKPDGTLCELGRGAMGVTYKAFDTNLRIHVALKVINTAFLGSDVACQRFLREARSAAALRHANVASVFHLGNEGDTCFYAMEFVPGETVDARLRSAGPLPVRTALEIALLDGAGDEQAPLSPPRDIQHAPGLWRIWQGYF